MPRTFCRDWAIRMFQGFWIFLRRLWFRVQSGREGVHAVGRRVWGGARFQDYIFCAGIVYVRIVRIV